MISAALSAYILKQEEEEEEEEEEEPVDLSEQVFSAAIYDLCCPV